MKFGLNDHVPLRMKLNNFDAIVLSPFKGMSQSVKSAISATTGEERVKTTEETLTHEVGPKSTMGVEKEGEWDGR